MKQQRNRWIAAALACGLLLAGCGTADSGQDSTGVTQSGRQRHHLCYDCE
ncbi:MAG: hypothetical protein SPE35_05535 [Butyricicoccus sp.]|nr:hypothetical protein [Butyricicoccus sp.]